MNERKWLQALRDAAGLTQKEVAELVLTTQQHYSLIEKGERRPSPRVAKRIADLFDFDWTVFYEEVLPNDETSATKETA